MKTSAFTILYSTKMLKDKAILHMSYIERYFFLSTSKIHVIKPVLSRIQDIISATSDHEGDIPIL